MKDCRLEIKKKLMQSRKIQMKEAVNNLLSFI